MDFDLWIKACEEFDTLIYPLEGEGKAALYLTYKIGEGHPGNRWHTYRKDITYQVFIDGSRRFVSLDYRTAYNYWRDHSK